MLPFVHWSLDWLSMRHLRSSGLYDAGFRFETEQQSASSLASESHGASVKTIVPERKRV
jgi:hypothetical protein